MEPWPVAMIAASAARRQPAVKRLGLAILFNNAIAWWMINRGNLRSYRVAADVNNCKMIRHCLVSYHKLESY